MRRIVLVTALAATLVYGHFTGYVHIAHATSLDCVVYIYSLIPSFFHPLLLSLALDLRNIAIRIIARYNPLLSHSCRGRVIAYGCLIRREGARREHLDYIYSSFVTSFLVKCILYAVVGPSQFSSNLLIAKSD
jgi:hypothetical protein